jgi:hypothetical protein
MIRTSFRFTVVCACLLLAACHSEKIRLVNEVLQMPQESTVYTAHNIWYETPSNIPSRNYLHGTILPFGSRVENVAIGEDSVQFSVAGYDAPFVIVYDAKRRMAPIEDYVRALLTIHPPETLAAGISEDRLQKIAQGEVTEGMTRKEVTLAYGPPSPHRTPSPDNDTWIYWTAEAESKRIVFQKDKVIGILQLQ